MPAVFDRRGIRFEYPENWQLDEPEISGKVLSVSVSGPEASFWALSVYRQPVDPVELLREAVGAMRSEYSSLEADEVHQFVEGRVLPGFDLNFYYLDLLNTALVRAFEHGGSSFLILCQAEDHDMRRLEPVFEAMTMSLVRELARDE